MRSFRCATVAVTVLIAGSTAWTHPFQNPPEFDPQIPWDEAFPYQRNLFVGFDTDPYTWPMDPDNTIARDLYPGSIVPGNVVHEGHDDAQLYESDWFDWLGPMQYFATDPTGSGRTGLIGVIDDDPRDPDLYPEADIQLKLYWHIDNHEWINREKRFYFESVYYTTGNGGTDTLFSSISSTVPVELDYKSVDLGGGWQRWMGWGTLVPNPAWEEMQNVIHFNPPEGNGTGQLYIDYMHIATECVPEPATLALLLLGSGMLLRRQRR